MERSLAGRWLNQSVEIDAVANFIASVQKTNGEIPWSNGDKTDPWDHVEAAMGLSVGGYLNEARRAYMWMAASQNKDGSWYASYRNGVAEDMTRDANFSAYIAVGVWHYFLITEDTNFLRLMWPSVKAAIHFVMRLQAPAGNIYWALNCDGLVDPMSLLTGSSSIHFSLQCALAIASVLGEKTTEWQAASDRLKYAIQHKPYHFNMTKSRYAMDWFYPILSGALTGAVAKRRLFKLWKRFIVEGQGVKCVSDRPWITIAETAELVLTLVAMGSDNLAAIILGWILGKKYEDGSYWCGYTWPDMVIWPEEKITWTNAAVLLAADAVYRLTSASNLFRHPNATLSD